MKKRFLKCISFMLVAILLISSMLIVHASSEEELEYEVGPTIDEVMSNPAFIEQQAQTMMESFSINMEEISQYQEAFDNLIANGSAYLDQEKHLQITDEFIAELDEDSLIILDDIKCAINKLIDSGVIEVEPETISSKNMMRSVNLSNVSYQVKTVSYSDFLEKDDKDLALMNEANTTLASLFITEAIEPQIASQSTLVNLPFGNIVNQNKIRIRNLYTFYLSIMDPVASYTMCVMDWVELVRGNGDWDYKIDRLYGQETVYNCYLGKKESPYTREMTGENMGNYNYGYTGRYLFPYSTLIAGSIVYGRFNIKNDSKDWPDIRLGFTDSGMVGYK